MLHDLAPDEQARALEGVRVTLGLRAPIAHVPRWPHDPAVIVEEEADPPRPPPPMVRVQMIGDRPVVMGQTAERPGQGIVVVGRAPSRRAQLPRGGGDSEQPVQRGYVRPSR
jgi:hypothetical protein